MGSEVRQGQHLVCVHDSDDAHFLEVQPLRHHLRSDEQVGVSGGESGDESFVGCP